MLPRTTSLPAVFIIFIPGKARHRTPVAHALLFFFMLSLGPLPARIAFLLLNDQFQLNRIAGIHFFRPFSTLSAVSTPLTPICSGNWAIVAASLPLFTAFFAIRSAVKSNHHHIRFFLQSAAHAARPAPFRRSAQTPPARQDAPSAGSASRSDL